MITDKINKDIMDIQLLYLFNLKLNGFKNIQIINNIIKKLQYTNKYNFILFFFSFILHFPFQFLNFDFFE